MTDPTPTSRRFALVRTVDHTGVSGTGFVAEGIQFQDESVALRWHGEHASTVVWASLDHALAVHGHDGATTVHWFDDEDGERIDAVAQREAAMNAAHAVLWAGGDSPTTLRADEVIRLATWLQHGDTTRVRTSAGGFVGTTTGVEIPTYTPKPRPF